VTLCGLLVHKAAAGRYAVDSACHAARALCDVLQLRAENESNWPKRPITTEHCSALSHICYTKRNIQQKIRKQAQIEWSEGYVTKDDAQFLLFLNTRVWSKALDVLQPTVRDKSHNSPNALNCKNVSKCNVRLIFDTTINCGCWVGSTAVANKYLEHDKYSMRRGITTYVAILTHLHVFVSIFDIQRDKQSLYKPVQALWVPAVWGSQISKQSAHGGGKVVSPKYRPPLPHREYSWYSFQLEAESTPGP